MKKIITILFLLLSFAKAHAQADTTHTGKDWRKAVVLPAGLIAGSFLFENHNKIFNKYDVQEWRDRQFPNFHTKIDDFLPFAPIASVYAFDWLGVKAKHDFLNRSAILAKATVFTGAMNYGGKYLFNKTRPDGDNYSYPSGHTTIAFAAATFLHKELGHRSIWYSIGGYTVATATGALRVLNNRHWLSDVVAGAGIGILGVNLGYLAHKRHWIWPKNKKTTSVLLLPSSNGGTCLIRF